MCVQCLCAHLVPPPTLTFYTAPHLIYLSSSCSSFSSPGVVVANGAFGKVSLLPLPRCLPWCCSLLIELFKQDLSIDILHNKCISCTHIPLSTLIATYMPSQSSRENMSPLVRLQPATGIHDAQLTSIHQSLTTILVRRSLQACWMIYNGHHGTTAEVMVSIMPYHRTSI